MSSLPVLVTEAGPQPTPPQALLSKLITLVSDSVPDYTANLPAGLITDLASTAVGALTQIDLAMVDLINSVSPNAANMKVLKGLGGIYGVQQGIGSNTSVQVIFSGTVGFAIPKGFLVSDGNNQYAVQHLTVIPTGGVTQQVFCLAVRPGAWAVPAGSVTMLVTSVPKSITLTCINPIDGFMGLPGQSVADYRAQVMQAGMFAVQGAPDNFRAAVQNVSGVQQRLVSYRHVSNDKWAAVVGGGDPYDVARAIYQSVPDISRLTVDVVDQWGNKPASTTVSIIDYPDTYAIGYIIPDSEMVTIILTWNSSSPNYVDPAAVTQASVNKIVDYVNGIYVGKPINIYALQQVFVQSLASTLSADFISLIKIDVAINGVTVPPDPNTGLVFGSVYNYFTTDASHVVVQQYE